MRSYTDMFKERCKQMRNEEELPNVVEVGSDITPSVRLYNIVKRSTDSRINKIVAIGFTLYEATKWLERKANKAKEKDDTLIFYDIVDQENKEALDPLWNPRPFCLQEIA